MKALDDYPHLSLEVVFEKFLLSKFEIPKFESRYPSLRVRGEGAGVRVQKVVPVQDSRVNRGVS